MLTYICTFAGEFRMWEIFLTAGGITSMARLAFGLAWQLRICAQLLTSAVIGQAVFRICGWFVA